MPNVKYVFKFVTGSIQICLVELVEH